MFIHSISKCPFCFTYILHMAFSARNQIYMILDSSHVTYFGKSIGLYDFFVKLHLTMSSFLMSGQYVHLPNRVQMEI